MRRLRDARKQQAVGADGEASEEDVEITLEMLQEELRMTAGRGGSRETASLASGLPSVSSPELGLDDSSRYSGGMQVQPPPGPSRSITYPPGGGPHEDSKRARPRLVAPLPEFAQSARAGERHGEVARTRAWTATLPATFDPLFPADQQHWQRRRTMGSSVLPSGQQLTSYVDDPRLQQSHYAPHHHGHIAPPALPRLMDHLPDAGPPRLPPLRKAPEGPPGWPPPESWRRDFPPLQHQQLQSSGHVLPPLPGPSYYQQPQQHQFQPPQHQHQHHQQQQPVQPPPPPSPRQHHQHQHQPQ